MSQITIQCTRLSGNGLKYMTLCIKSNMSMREIRFILCKRCKKSNEDDFILYLDKLRNHKVDLDKHYINYNSFHEIFFDDMSMNEEGTFKKIYNTLTCCMKRRSFYDYSPLV